MPPKSGVSFAKGRGPHNRVFYSDQGLASHRPSGVGKHDKIKHALGLDQQQGHDLSPFTGQNVVSATCRRGVHGFHPNALAHQGLQPLGFGKAQFVPTAKDNELATDVGPWTEVTRTEAIKMASCPDGWWHLGQTGHRQRLAEPDAIDLDPGPLVGVDGRCIGFVWLEFHGGRKIGRARDRRRSAGNRVGKV